MPIKSNLRKILHLKNKLFYLGNKYYCTCCNRSYRKFLDAGINPRKNAKCPGCGAVERHRLLYLYLKNKTNLFKDDIKLLYVAPNEVLQNIFVAHKNIDYLSADLNSKLAMEKMDITSINYPNDHFDCIICNHVLEHIPNDRKAISELFRVLKPGGWSILQVPVYYNFEKTFEDPNITDPNEKEKLFGQEDHVRVYGLDYIDRLKEAGFIVKADNYIEHFDQSLIKKYCLNTKADRYIYFCSKPVI